MSDKKDTEKKEAKHIVWALASGNFAAGIIIDGQAVRLSKGRTEIAALEGLIAKLIALQYCTVIDLSEAKYFEYRRAMESEIGAA